MVLKPYDPVVGVVIRESDGAVLMAQGTEWQQNGSYAVFGSDIWIPKSNLHDESLEELEEAVAGEKIEIYVARWWLEEQAT